MRKETRVVHSFFGEGVVLATRYAGQYLLVSFEKTKLIQWVKRHELLEVKTVSPKKSRKRRDESEYSYLDNIKIINKKEKPVFSKKRRLIEALRLGIVPEDMVFEFTFGREKEIEFILNSIQKKTAANTGDAFVINDEYGKGKTHLLMYLKKKLLEDGYATAFVSFDPQEITPYRVKRVYNLVCRTLQYKKNNQLHDLFDLLNTEDLSLKKEHLYLSKFFKYKEIKGGDPLIFNWISGEKINRQFLNLMYLPALLEDYIAANIYLYLISGIATLLRKIGLKGLVIFFDESESLVELRRRDWKEKGANFLKGLILTAKNQTQEDKLTRDLGRGSIGKQSVRINKKTGLIYSRRSSTTIPYRYVPDRDDPEPLIFPIFAFTPSNADLYFTIIENIDKKNIINLKSLEYKTIVEMFNYLNQIYGEIYHFSIKTEHIPSVLDAIMEKSGYNIRKTIKAMIEILDLLRFYPQDSPSSLFGTTNRWYW